MGIGLNPILSRSDIKKQTLLRPGQPVQLDNRALNLAGPGSLEEIAEHEDDDDQNSGYKTGKKTRMH